MDFKAKFADLKKNPTVKWSVNTCSGVVKAGIITVAVNGVANSLDQKVRLPRI